MGKGVWVRLKDNKVLGRLADYTAFAEGYSGNCVLVEIGGEHITIPKSALSPEAHKRLNMSLREQQE